MLRLVGNVFCSTEMPSSQLSIYNDYNDDPVYAPEQPQGIFSWPSVTWLYAEDKLFRVCLV